MLRALAALLLLANLLFFGWRHGAFAPGLPPPHQGEREPERVAAQVSPKLVTVLPPTAASAAVTAARAAASVCMEAGPLTEAEAAVAEVALAPAQLPEGSWTREAAPQPPLWLVYAGRLPDAASRRAREAELRKFDLAFERLEAPAELAPALVLSRHPTRAAAEAALAAAQATTVPGQPPIKGLRVVALPSPPPQVWLRAAHADADIQARLRLLPPTVLAGGFKPCTAPP